MARGRDRAAGRDHPHCARTDAAQRCAVPGVARNAYLRDMSSGRGKLEPLDNDRYGSMPWTSARDVLRAAAA